MCIAQAALVPESRIPWGHLSSPPGTREEWSWES